MGRTVRRLAVLAALALLLRRRLSGQRRRGTATPGESPGWRYAIGRVRGILAPPVEISPPPAGVRFEKDVEVAMRDGTVLRVNVFRPEREGRYPVIMGAHPYGKDKMPKRGPFGYRPNFQFRILRQPVPLSFSAWTTWEAPDPAYWTRHGYAVVNCDVRGFGTSDGVGSLLTDAEARDYHDLIEWAGAQPWSNGKVGLNGVSYLAFSQYKAAGLRPPHLAAICPWEGFSDWYRDTARPGGILENGFMRMWTTVVGHTGRNDADLRRGRVEHPLRDGWWAARTPDLEKIEVPMLVCGSFSDHEVHTRGSFRAFERANSRHRWLYTHRGGKWAEYYSEGALAFQRRFFDHFLKGEENGMPEVPPVRLEVREDRDTVREVRSEEAWPLARTRWTDLYLGADGRLTAAPAAAASEAAAGTGAVAFDLRSGRAAFMWDVPEDTEITGPMALRLFVELRGSEDAHLFVGVQKLRAGRVVPFEGSLGYGYDRVTNGWLKPSLRKLDPTTSTPWSPVHTYDEPQPLRPGEVVPVEIALLPSATFFRGGEQVRLLVQGRWFSARNPLFGQFPTAYERGPRGTCVLHCGGEHDARLTVPVVPPQTTP